GDQQILNLLSPQPTPTGSFQAVIVSRICKAALHQVTPTAAVTLGGATVGLPLCRLDHDLIERPSQHASLKTARTLCSQPTCLTDSCIRFVNVDAIKATGAIVAQMLTCRALVGVGLLVVVEMFATE